MSTSLGSNLVSGSISASLAEIDVKTRDPDRPPVGDIVVGPFGVLDFAPDAPSNMQGEQQQPESHKYTPPEPEGALRSPPQTVPDTAVAQDPDVALPSLLNDSPSHIDDFLHWSDILGLSPEQPGFFQPSMLNFDMYLSADAVADNGSNGFVVPEDLAPVQNIAAMTPPSSAIEMASTFLDAAALADAPLLFKHFNERVVPQMVIMPLGDKSPWRVMNLAAAMATYNDLTILGSQRISHARLANLYGLLACSAVHLSSANNSVGSPGHWQQAAGQMFEQARDHMQKSLRYETKDPKRAKYKDQLMAICCLIEYTVCCLTFMHALLTVAGHIRAATTCKNPHGKRRIHSASTRIVEASNIPKVKTPTSCVHLAPPSRREYLRPARLQPIDLLHRSPRHQLPTPSPTDCPRRTKLTRIQPSTRRLPPPRSPRRRQRPEHQRAQGRTNRATRHPPPRLAQLLRHPLQTSLRHPRNLAQPSIPNNPSRKRHGNLPPGTARRREHQSRSMGSPAPPQYPPREPHLLVRSYVSKGRKRARKAA